MFGRNVPALAGIIPPPKSDIATVGDCAVLGSDDVVNYSDILHLPHGLKGYFDYEEGKECGLNLDKPLFLDFTGHACFNCRRMEENVWSDPRVMKILDENYLVVALYVDDKTLLPEEKWYVSKYDGKMKKTIGKQNFDFQITKFNSNAQPYYVLLDHEEELLLPPKSYDLNIIHTK